MKTIWYGEENHGWELWGLINILYLHPYGMGSVTLSLQALVSFVYRKVILNMRGTWDSPWSSSQMFWIHPLGCVIDIGFFFNPLTDWKMQWYWESLLQKERVGLDKAQQILTIFSHCPPPAHPPPTSLLTGALLLLSPDVSVSQHNIPHNHPQESKVGTRDAIFLPSSIGYILGPISKFLWYGDSL